MKTIIYNQDNRVGEWVFSQMDADWTPNRGRCIGLENSEGELIGGMVVENWNGSNCFVHIAGSDQPGWATGEFVRACFYYIFVTLDCKRLTGIVESSNKRARHVDERLGCEVEALLLGAGKDGDLIVYRMFREDCKWLNTEVTHG